MAGAEDNLELGILLPEKALKVRFQVRLGAAQRFEKGHRWKTLISKSAPTTASKTDARYQDKAQETRTGQNSCNR
jgi:hypothetical protein